MFCLIIDSQPNKLYCMCIHESNAKNFSFGMDACMETFVILIKFMTDAASEEGLVWLGTVIEDAMEEWHKRLWMCIHAKARHFKHLVWFKSTHNSNVLEVTLWYCVKYIKSICYSWPFVFQVRCGKKYDMSLVANLLLSPIVGKKFKNRPAFLKLWTNIKWSIFMDHGIA